MTEVILYLLTGATAGVSAGLLGIGGGLIIVPILFFIFSSQPVASEHVMHMALATSLATIIVTSISSARAHHKRGAVLWPIVFNLSPGIIIGALLGGMLASSLANDTLRPVFGVFEFMVAIHLLVNYKPGINTISISGIKSLTGGVVIGGISSFVGVGGGTLTVPFLLWHNIANRFFHIPVHTEPENAADLANEATPAKPCVVKPVRSNCEQIKTVQGICLPLNPSAKTQRTQRCEYRCLVQLRSLGIAQPTYQRSRSARVVHPPGFRS